MAVMRCPEKGAPKRQANVHGGGGDSRCEAVVIGPLG
jgi:hypothetical protein